MATRTWEHSLTADVVKERLVRELDRRSLSGFVSWSGYGFESIVAGGTILKVKGIVLPRSVKLTECTGALADPVLKACDDVMPELLADVPQKRIEGKPEWTATLGKVGSFVG